MLTQQEGKFKKKIVEKFRALHPRNVLARFRIRKKLKKAGFIKGDIKEITRLPLMDHGEIVCDIYRKGGSVVVAAPIAGVDIETIELWANPFALVVRGQRVKPYRVAKENMMQTECFWGSFVRMIDMPYEIDHAGVVYYLEHGILFIESPLIARSRPLYKISTSGSKEATTMNHLIGE